MQMQLRLSGDTLLRKKCLPVKEFDHELKVLIDNMYETMYHYKGIGLAAPQIGILTRVFVIDVLDNDTGNWQRGAYINPEITGSSAETSNLPETCLSIPKRTVMVERSKFIVITYKDVSGRLLHQSATGLIACCIQHELDHLDGVLMIDLG